MGSKWRKKTLKVSIARPEGQGKESPKANVYMANLPLDYTEDNLNSMVEEDYGPVSDIRIFTNAHGKSRGCAVVSMQNEADAKKVIAELHDAIPEGGTQRLVVKAWIQRERVDRNTNPGGSAFLNPQQPPPSYGYGTPSIPSYPGAGYGPTRHPTCFDQRYNPTARIPNPYNSHDSAYPYSGAYPHNAYPHHSYPPFDDGYGTPMEGYPYPMDAHTAPSRAGTAGYPPRHQPRSGAPQNSLFVFHLPPDLDNDGLQELFQPFATNGGLESAKVILDNSGMSKGFGFVNFSDKVDAQTAIDVMNGYQMGSKYLKVEFKGQKQ